MAFISYLLDLFFFLFLGEFLPWHDPTIYTHHTTMQFSSEQFSTSSDPVGHVQPQSGRLGERRLGLAHSQDGAAAAVLCHILCGAFRNSFFHEEKPLY